MCRQTHTRAHTHRDIHMHIHINVHTYRHGHGMYTCAHTCIYTCTHIHICIHMHIHMHTTCIPTPELNGNSYQPLLSLSVFIICITNYSSVSPYFFWPSQGGHSFCLILWALVTPLSGNKLLCHGARASLTLPTPISIGLCQARAAVCVLITGTGWGIEEASTGAER